MRRIIALSALNVMLLAALLARPAAATDEARGCCKASVDGPNYCCTSCCWIKQNCSNNDACNTVKTG